MTTDGIDQEHYHRLAEWAENADIDLTGGKVGAAAVKSSRELLRRVGQRDRFQPNGRRGVDLGDSPPDRAGSGNPNDAD